MTLPSSKIYLFQIKISVYVNFRFTSKLKNLTGSVLLYNITIKVKTLIFIVHITVVLYFKQPAGLGYIRVKIRYLVTLKKRWVMDFEFFAWNPLGP